MWRLAGLCCVAITGALAALASADDGSAGKMCKLGWHMCGCKHEHPRRLCENDELYKKLQAACWGNIAQHQCAKGTRADTLRLACAEAKKADKLVLYVGNTGG